MLAASPHSKQVWPLLPVDTVYRLLAVWHLLWPHLLQSECLWQRGTCHDLHPSKVKDVIPV